MYTFRIKSDSELDGVIDLALSGELDGDLSVSSLVDGGHSSKQAARTLLYLSRWSDNFVFGKQGASYTEVVPQTTIIQEAGEVHTTAPQTQYNGPSILWPDTPMIMSLEDFPWFRKPPWYDRMAKMVEAGKHISLAGPPGIGKSSAVEYLAASQGKVLVNVSADAGLRRRDLTGNVELVNSHTQFQVAQYLAAVRNGWWVKIDEVNAAEPDALMYLNSQMAPPFAASFYGKSVKVHSDFRLFVTYNPGLVGTKPLPPAFKDRFFPIKLAFPNENQLRKMLEANGMPGTIEITPDDIPLLDVRESEWTDVIVKFGMEAWAQHKKGRMRYQITPRRLMDAIDLVKLAELNVFDALDAAVIQAVDNLAEARVLKETLRVLKQKFEFGRN